MNNPLNLDAGKIINTVDRLEKRIADRFPDSGLRKVCHEFLEVANHTKDNINWISSPNIPLRIFSYLLILIGVIGLIVSVKYIDLAIQDTNLGNVVIITEAIFNDIVLLGGGIFFLITMESRVKRKRALKSLHELRVIAHVIDMHQLTKDPNLSEINKPTQHSPQRTYSKFELERYLDYCSEASSLVAKIAALYSQNLPDEVVVRSVNEIEVLTTGLSRKIWQKIMILNRFNQDE